MLGIVLAEDTPLSSERIPLENHQRSVPDSPGIPAIHSSGEKHLSGCFRSQNKKSSYSTVIILPPLNSVYTSKKKINTLLFTPTFKGPNP